MNHAAKLVLLIFSAAGTAVAGTFTLDTLPPVAQEQMSAPPATHLYFKLSDQPTFAAAHSFDKEGYIGTMHLPDPSVSIPTSEIAVPEPASMVLLGSGLVVAALRRRRRAGSA